MIEDPKATVQPDFELRVKFVLRHPALEVGRGIRVRLDGEVIFDATIAEPGRVRFGEADLDGELKEPAAGQVVSVEVAGQEILAEPLRHD